MAYGRFWEANTLLEQFDSKLTDVLIYSLALDRSKKAKYALQTDGVTEETLKALETGQKRFKNVLTHLISLLHAVAFSSLRDDCDLYNITVRFHCPSPESVLTRACASLHLIRTLHMVSAMCSRFCY